MVHKLSRRRALTSTSVGLLAALTTPTTTAETRFSAHQSLRSIHRFSVGRLRVTVIDDARVTFPSATFAADQPAGTIGRYLSEYGLSQNFTSLHMQVVLVENGPHKVLLDTGMGVVTLPENEPDNGRLLAGLAAVGVSADDITSVIISHGHPDHIGSCSNDGEPVFRNATYFISPDELEFWTQQPGTEQNLMNLMLAVGSSQLLPVRERIQPYKGGEMIVPGITAVAARGHTLGHHAMVLHDGEHKLLHLMDTAVHYLAGLEHPDWIVALEMDHQAAADTRRRLFALAADEKMLVAGYHFPFPGIGRIFKHSNGWRFVPMQTA